MSSSDGSTPANAKILGQYILRRGHHNPFLIGMRPSARIALFIRNVVLHIAFDGDYVWPAEPLAAFRPYVTQAPNSSTPLSVRLGTDSAMNPPCSYAPPLMS